MCVCVARAYGFNLETNDSEKKNTRNEKLELSLQEWQLHVRNAYDANFFSLEALEKYYRKLDIILPHIAPISHSKTHTHTHSAVPVWQINSSARANIQLSLKMACLCGIFHILLTFIFHFIYKF